MFARHWLNCFFALKWKTLLSEFPRQCLTANAGWLAGRKQRSVKHRNSGGAHKASSLKMPKMWNYLDFSEGWLTARPWRTFARKPTWNQAQLWLKYKGPQLRRDSSGRSTPSTTLHKSGRCSRGARWKVLLRRKKMSRQHAWSLQKFMWYFQRAWAKRWCGLIEQNESLSCSGDLCIRTTTAYHLSNTRTTVKHGAGSISLWDILFAVDIIVFKGNIVQSQMQACHEYNALHSTTAAF